LTHNNLKRIIDGISSQFFQKNQKVCYETLFGVTLLIIYVAIVGIANQKKE